MFFALINTIVFTGAEKITGKAIIIEDDRIKAIVDSSLIPTGTEIFDYNECFIAPGLIDLQIAGSGGYLFSEKPSGEALHVITDCIIKSGTTGFLISIPSNSFNNYYKFIRIIRDNPYPAILGLHLEGPYINKAKRGGHNIDYIRKPNKTEIEKLMTEAVGVVKMITLAPELCNSEFVRLLKDNGVIVAAGHSNATFKEAIEGFKWGIKTTTHLFNAMSQMHHRDPGLPGATFEKENIYASIIADGIHVNYNTISIAKKIMKERLYLISDAVEESLTGAYLHVRQNDRFTLPDGTLSGSTLTMLKAVKNCVEHINIPLDEALRMASTYPARLMGYLDIGRIVPGYKANLIIFDKNFEVKQVIIEGKFYL